MVRQSRKVRVGCVVSDKMEKTVVVAVPWQQRHPLYRKNIRRITRFYADDRDSQCRLGDLVRIEETRPLSRLKRWRVLAIVERREVVDVKPAELDEGILSEEQEQPVEPEEGIASEEEGTGEEQSEEAGT